MLFINFRVESEAYQLTPFKENMQVLFSAQPGEGQPRQRAHFSPATLVGSFSILGSRDQSGSEQSCFGEFQELNVRYEN